MPRIEIQIKELLTFDDVLLVPKYSEVLPTQVDVRSKFSRNIPLGIPIVSAAMDTVTEHRMAVAMALNGGIGVIHRNLSPEAQAEEVKRVKRFRAWMVVNPYTLSPDATVGEAKNLMNSLGISGVPVVDERGRLLGLITKRDIFYSQNDLEPVTKHMTPKEKLIVARYPITLEEAKEILRKHRIEKLPVINENCELMGLINAKDVFGHTEETDANVDELGRLRVAAAIGPSKDFERRAQLLYEAGVDAFVVDTAHGHSKRVGDLVEYLKESYPKVDVVAGNVATYEGAMFLIDKGADAIKVGVGPGSICTTRVVAGVGVPQLSAIMDCYRATSRNGVPLIADGGIRYSGDIVKAISAGADAVMVGSLLAGTDESPGEDVFYEGRRYKTYRGMGSLGAMMEGGASRYGWEGALKFVPEGVEGMVPYRGSVKDVIFQLVGGLKAGMGYLGASNIEELRERSEFVKITHAGIRESHPHDVFITKEAPNYNKGV